MKKIIITLLVLTGFGASAQNQNNQEAKSKLEAARIGLITERLDLTPEQAQQFWPIYNEYAEQRRQVQMQYRQRNQGLDMNNLSEEQNMAMIRARQEEKQQLLNLESKYTNRMIEVINARQIMALKKAEDDFRAMIIKRLEMRQQQQLQRQQMLLQMERKKQQGNN